MKQSSGSKKANFLRNRQERFYSFQNLIFPVDFAKLSISLSKWRLSCFSIVNFEHISHLSLKFLLLMIQ